MMATPPGWADHAAPRGPSAQATLLPAPVTGSAYKGERQRDEGRDWQTNEPRNGDGRARSVACPGGVEGQSRSRSGCLKDSNSKPPPPLYFVSGSWKKPCMRCPTKNGVNRSFPA